MDRPKYVAVDFDDTLCVRESWGDTIIGKPRVEVVKIINELRVLGWKTILWTCRNGSALEDAIKWCKENNIILDYVNENPEAIEWFRKTCGISHADWSPKVFADLYIDDSSLNPFSFLSELHNFGFRNPSDIAVIIDRCCHQRVFEKIEKFQQNNGIEKNVSSNS